MYLPRFVKLVIVVGWEISSETTVSKISENVIGVYISILPLVSSVSPVVPVSEVSPVVPVSEVSPVVPVSEVSPVEPVPPVEVVES